jgi:hypothetical protein
MKQDKQGNADKKGASGAIGAIVGKSTRSLHRNAFRAVLDHQPIVTYQEIGQQNVQEYYQVMHTEKSPRLERRIPSGGNSFSCYTKPQIYE